MPDDITEPLTASSEPVTASTEAITDEGRAELRRLLAEAAPWELIGGGEYITGLGILVAPDDGGISPENAALIIALRNNAEALLAMIDEQGETIESLSASMLNDLAQGALDRAEQAEAALDRVQELADLTHQIGGTSVSLQSLDAALAGDDNGGGES